MCHSTENLYRYTHGSLLRASDDFYPSRPASHTMHIVNVGYNSLLLGELGVPDWDMFTSLNEAERQPRGSREAAEVQHRGSRGAA